LSDRLQPTPANRENRLDPATLAALCDLVLLLGIYAVDAKPSHIAALAMRWRSWIASGCLVDIHGGAAA
jgi:hypothetical protein